MLHKRFATLKIHRIEFFCIIIIQNNRTKLSLIFTNKIRFKSFDYSLIHFCKKVNKMTITIITNSFSYSIHVFKNEMRHSLNVKL